MRAPAWLLHVLVSLTLVIPGALVASAPGCASQDDGTVIGDDGVDPDASSGDGSGDDDGSSGGDGSGSPDGSSGGDGSGSPDAGPPDPGQACAAPGALGNEIGVGLYCTPGGGECDSTSGAGLCTVDFMDAVPAFCTTPCFSDDACGSDASCEDNGGVLSGCTPSCLLGQ